MCVCACAVLSHRYDWNSSLENKAPFSFSFSRYTASAPAIHIYRKYYRNNNAVSAIRFKMGSKIHGQTTTLRYWTNFTRLQCHSSVGEFVHFSLCKREQIPTPQIEMKQRTSVSNSEYTSNLFFPVWFYFQVLYQLSVFSERKINFWCEELDYSDSFLGIRSAQLSYCYFLVKLLDLFDTVFFVLRKRTRQISFLHLYHHVLILIGAYIAVAWAPGNPQQYFR